MHVLCPLENGSKLDDVSGQLRKKLKTSLQTSRRLRKMVTLLAEVVESLKNKQLISNGCADMLESFSKVQTDLFQRTSKQTRSAYSPELKAFATTLQFYSLKAYNFVRRTFNLALPHPNHIRK